MWRRDKWAYAVVNKGLSWAWSTQPPPYRPFFQPHTQVLDQFVTQLTQANAIERTNYLAFQGRLFSRPKKDSTTRRVILDLSKLNQCIPCPKFKMTTVQQVRDILPKGSWTVSLDLKDAYWHVPIKKSYKKFLGFKLGHHKFQFRVIPFGLNIAPIVFTRITKVLLKTLRLKGVCLVVYLDDWLVWAPSKAECIRARDVVVNHIGDMGFIINMKKSRMEPAQSFLWLGIHWHTKSTLLSLPRTTRTDIRDTLNIFLASKRSSRRSLERVLGKLQFAAIVDPVYKTLLKCVNRYWVHLAKPGLRDVIRKTPLSLLRFLKKWISTDFLSRKTNWRPPPPYMDVYTDASKKGWGFHTSDGRHGSGKWNKQFTRLHINILELATVLIALQSLKLPTNSHIRLHSDNSTTVHCLNRRGSARSSVLNGWILSIGILLKKKRVFLSAFHVAGIRNVIADALSRSHPLNSEWRLDSQSFSWICSLGPPPAVDLFATSENTQLQTHVSPIREPTATATDAFLQDWSRWEVIYLFPPTSQILKVLDKLKDFKGTAYLVTPYWPNQVWFPHLLQVSRANQPIPHPILTQKVGGKNFCCKSKALLRLHVWIF